MLLIVFDGFWWPRLYIFVPISMVHLLNVDKKTNHVYRGKKKHEWKKRTFFSKKKMFDVWAQRKYLLFCSITKFCHQWIAQHFVYLRIFFPPIFHKTHLKSEEEFENPFHKRFSHWHFSPLKIDILHIFSSFIFFLSSHWP